LAYLFSNIVVLLAVLFSFRLKAGVEWGWMGKKAYLALK
jgi:hypothetical protein